MLLMPIASAVAPASLYISIYIPTRVLYIYIFLGTHEAVKGRKVSLLVVAAAFIKGDHSAG